MEIDVRKVISEDFWIDQLRGFEPHSFVPFKSKQDTTGSTQQYLLPFPQSLNDRLNELTKGIPTNGYVLMAAAVSILLSRYMATGDIVMVTPRLLISQTNKDIPKSILFLRLQIPKDGTVRNLLQVIQTTVNQAHKHQDYDLEALLRRFGADGISNPDALLQIGFSYSALNQNSSFCDKATLQFHIEESQKQYNLAIAYKDKIFSEAFVGQMAVHWLRILEFVVWQPDKAIAKVEFLSETERTTLLEEFNATQTSYPQQKQVIDWFEEQVERSPDAVAIVCEQRSLTYRDLNQQANQVAADLQTKEVEPENRVGLLLTRSEYLIIAILGVLKVGAAYLPIEPEFPIERIRYMVADSGCQIILSEVSQEDKWASLGAVQVVDIRKIPTSDVANITRLGDRQQLAYVIYTSGSTGLPKGVAIENRSLMNYLCWASKYYFEQNPQLGDMALFTSPAFDLTITTIFLPLLRGKKLYIYQESSPEVVLETCFRGDTDIDTIKLTPSHIQILNYIPVTPSNIKLVIVGGEELKPTHIQLLKERNVSMRIYNEYGPTEATVGCTVVEAEIEKITIGKAIANSQIYILNEDFQLQPLGVTGEICIGGAGLARGYWNRQQLTQERFIAHPFCQGKRIYRTGDLGRWLNGGELEYLGRKDSQVKIRGYRVELPEIEQQLLECSQIDHVAVITNDSEETGLELIAYVVGSAELNLEDVRIELSEKLPAYMIPQHLIRLERLPLTANGKLDLRSLPKPQDLNQSSTYQAPSNQLEAQLVEICAEVLTPDKIGINDNLLALGANSLKIIQIVSRVRRRLGVDLNLKEVFANLTVKEIAEIVRVKQPMHLSAIEKVPIAEHYALSHAQRQFWLSAQMGAAIAYNIPGAIFLEGSLNQPALLQAFSSLVARHEVLRTTFICVGGEPRQQINQDINFCLEERDLTREAEPINSALSIIEKEATLPFDLEKDSLLRVHLLQLAPMQHLLFINIHHIIFDGWSIGLLLQELTTLYKVYQDGQENPLKPLELQYKDYATWQNTFLNSNQARVHQVYWQQKLQDFRPLDLPTDYPRSAIQTFQGAVIPLKLSSQSLSILEEFSKQYEVSQFAIVLAAIKALLHRYTGKEDIIVATPVSERTQVDWETQIGLYLNTLVLRDKVSRHDRFIDLIQRVKQTALEAFIHQVYPFNKLVQELHIQRDPSRNPVFDVGYTWMDEIGSQIDQITFSNIKVTQIPLEREQKTAVTDLWFYFEKRGDRIEGYLTYNCNLFSEETANFIKQAFVNILEQVLENPEIELSVLNLFDQVEMTKKQISVELNL